VKTLADAGAAPRWTEVSSQEPTYQVVLFKNAFDKTPKPQTRTWAELVDDLSVEFHPAGKTKGPAFSPCTYAEGATRGNENVMAVNLAVLDFDHAGDKEEWVLGEAVFGLASLAYTTFSHTDDGHRFRLVVPLSEPVPAAKWPAVAKAIQDRFGNLGDASCKDPARLYFRHATGPDGGQPRIVTSSGGPLDWRSLFPAGDAPEAPTGVRLTEPSGLPVSQKTFNFLEGLAPEGERHYQMTSAARNLWGAGWTTERAIAALFDGMVKAGVPVERARPEVEALVNDFWSKPAPPLESEAGTVDPGSQSGLETAEPLDDDYQGEQDPVEELKEDGQIGCGRAKVSEVDGVTETALFELTRSDLTHRKKTSYLETSGLFLLARDAGTGVSHPDDLSALFTLADWTRQAMTFEEGLGNNLSLGLTLSTAIPDWDPDEVEPDFWGPFVPSAANVVLLVGETSSGKTSLLFRLVSHLAKGAGYLGQPAPTKPLRVLHLDPETPGRTREYLAALVGKSENWAFYRSDRSLAELAEQNRVLRACRDFGADLLVIDTLTDVWPAEDENSNAEANYQILALRRLAVESGCVVLATLHTGKAQADQKFARGATARTDKADQVMFLTTDSTEPDVKWLRVSKSRFGHNGRSIGVRFAGERDFELTERAWSVDLKGLSDAERVVANYLHAKVEPGRTFQAEWLLGAIRDTGSKVSESGVRRTLDKLVSASALVAVSQEAAGRKPAVYLRLDDDGEVGVTMVPTGS